MATGGGQSKALLSKIEQIGTGKDKTLRENKETVKKVKINKRMLKGAKGKSVEEISKDLPWEQKEVPYQLNAAIAERNLKVPNEELDMTSDQFNPLRAIYDPEFQVMKSAKAYNSVEECIAAIEMGLSPTECGREEENDDGIQSLRNLSKKPMEVRKKIRVRFTAEEDGSIKEAMIKVEATEKVKEADQVIKDLSRKVGRPTCSVFGRWMYFVRNQGQVINHRKPFSMKEDGIILDNVMDKLETQKLAKVYVAYSDEFVEKYFGDRNLCSVVHRWSHVLQPLLLQHYAGTLGQGIEQELANHIKENYQNFGDIDWEEVVSKPEYAGHTVRSLRNVFDNLKTHASEKLCILRSELTPGDVDAYTRKAEIGKHRSQEKVKQRQAAVIKYFLHQVKYKNLKDFL